MTMRPQEAITSSQVVKSLCSPLCISTYSQHWVCQLKQRFTYIKSSLYQYKAFPCDLFLCMTIPVIWFNWTLSKPTWLIFISVDVFLPLATPSLCCPLLCPLYLYTSELRAHSLISRLKSSSVSPDGISGSLLGSLPALLNSWLIFNQSI